MFGMFGVSLLCIFGIINIFNCVGSDAGAIGDLTVAPKRMSCLRSRLRNLFLSLSLC